MNFADVVTIMTIVPIIIGYFFGGIMWSIIIGKLFFKKDPRNFESQNAGATNSSRIYGKKVGLLILLLDISKGILPTIICFLLAKFVFDIGRFNDTNFNFYSLSYLAGVSAIIGHCFPVFFKFKGGKGVATFGAFYLTIIPFGAILQLLILVTFVFILRYVSLSSLISTIMSWIWIFIPGLNYNFILNSNINDLYYFDYGSIYWLLFIWALLFISTTLIWYRHKSNIIALKNKEERKFSFK